MTQKLCITHLPDLLEVQKSSFCWFLVDGLAEELSKFSSIFDLTGNLELRFYGQEYKLRRPKLSIAKIKEKNSTYAFKIYLPI